MLSNQRMSASQCGQRDPGWTMEIPRGTLWITTLAKLPKAAPKTNNAVATYHPGRNSTGQ